MLVDLWALLFRNIHISSWEDSFVLSLFSSTFLVSATRNVSWNTPVRQAPLAAWIFYGNLMKGTHGIGICVSLCSAQERVHPRFDGSLLRGNVKNRSPLWLIEGILAVVGGKCFWNLLEAGMTIYSSTASGESWKSRDLWSFHFFSIYSLTFRSKESVGQGKV